MANFLVLLGWSPGTDEEILSLEELTQRFSLDGINKKSAIFDTTKLEWMNSQYIVRLAPDELERRLTDALFAAPPGSETSSEWRAKLLDVLKVRARTLQGIVEQAQAYFRDEIEYDQGAIQKHFKNAAETTERLAKVRQRLAESEWNEHALEQAIRAVAEEYGVGAGKIIHPLRVAVTGTAASPGMFDVLVLLGRQRSLKRLDAALDMLRSRE
jgi:glutamyl-tRNA synthetase